MGSERSRYHPRGNEALLQNYNYIEKYKMIQRQTKESHCVIPGKHYCTSWEKLKRQT